MGASLNNHSYSFTAWAKRTATGAYQILIEVGNQNSNNDNIAQMEFTPSNYFNCSFWGDPGSQSSSAYTDGNWHFYACTFDVSTKKMTAYIDGLSVGSGNTTGTLSDSGYGTIGAVYSFGSYTAFWPGTLDDVRVYNRALSASEVYNLYKSTGGQ